MSHPLVNLVSDIYKVIGDPNEGLLTCESSLGRDFGSVLSGRLNPDSAEPGGNSRRGTLRLSNLGTECDRALWFKVNSPETGQPLAPNVRFKFLFGDSIELLLLEYARKAGYRVEGLQSRLELNGIVGHRDAVIDGMVVDCKSASTAGFNKFRAGLQKDNDAFGYLTQLKSYLYASREDEAVTEKNTAGFLVADKQYGDICLDVHTFTDEELEAVRYLAEAKKTLTALPEAPPVPYETKQVQKGKHAGKHRLGTMCNYCEFKFNCYRHLEKDDSSQFEAWYQITGPTTGEAF